MFEYFCCCAKGTEKSHLGIFANIMCDFEMPEGPRPARMDHLDEPLAFSKRTGVTVFHSPSLGSSID